ncbi:CPXV012 protein [Caenorhabditis elegans]|uniref:CPXV012 protein n=1 Tax=Caenorhabditis elegans TaxID=6239 RepID=A0A060Q617_CAEEL|nr:CPXV012 protein [Caenorhabditis elegans]CCE71936.2 CPXV012 protein [Caenorhabditis elegans]|eukprot:NP_001294222.1 Uncharacterized protein CELE_Y57G11B.8 [Caenorhabditis elegans]
MIFYAFLLLPLVSGQWGVPHRQLFVTKDQCIVEYKSIMDCVRTYNVYSYVDDSPLLRKSENLDLIDDSMSWIVLDFYCAIVPEFVKHICPINVGF